MPLPTINQLGVYYKYASQMPVYNKSTAGFIQSIEDKYNDFIDKKLELHVSPFYNHKHFYFYQIVFDFDGPKAYKEAQSFCRAELIKEKLPMADWFVEFTGTDVHVVNKVAYGPVTLNQIRDIRDHVKRTLGKYYPTLDVSSSIRHLPIRRSLSLDSKHKLLVLPARVTMFMAYSHEHIVTALSAIEITRARFNNILVNYVLPTKIQSIQDAPFGISKALKGKPTILEPEKKKITKFKKKEIEVPKHEPETPNQ